MNNTLKQLSIMPVEWAKSRFFNPEISNNRIAESKLTNPLFEEKAYEVFIKAVKSMPRGSVLSLVIENNGQSNDLAPQPTHDVSVAPIARQQILPFQTLDTEGEQINDAVWDSQLMGRIYEYIANHIKEEYLYIEGLAQACALSRSQLFRKIKAIADTTPAQLVRDYRLDAAYYLIKTDPTIRISEVMYAVGFSDAKHFGKIFKKRFGVPPQKVKMS